MNEKQIKLLRAKFKAIDEQLANLNSAISWLSLAVISLNKLAQKRHSKEEIAEAIKEATKQLAKINAALKGMTSEPDDMWDRYFGRKSTFDLD